MELKDLVPPLELCKQIPEGKFKNSALIWCEDEDGLELVMPREIAEFEKEGIPALTLQEILDALPTYIEEYGKRFYLCLVDWRNSPSGTFQIGYARAAHHGLEPSDFKEKDANTATAALRLWLSVTSDKSDKSVTQKEQ